MKKPIITLIFSMFAIGIIAQQTTVKNPELSVFAESKNQWTGIAISKTNRIFVNFPRWSSETPVSVGEVVNGKVVPYPTKDWNNWEPGRSTNNKFICVQSVFIDELDMLWILDPGYELSTDSTKGAHIYKFNLENNSFVNDYLLPVEKISGKSYLNDLRIDNKNNVVYMSDSNLGGIVIMDLTSNAIRRVLSTHYSTLTEVPQIMIEGFVRTHPVHSDGIALDPQNEQLYYCSLMGENVYRVPTKALLNTNLTEKQLSTQVEKFAKTGANDGIIFDKKGNLYLTSIEKNAISKLDTTGKLEELISDEEIKWPDSFAFDNKGNLFFTISKIHLPKDKRGMYKLFQLKLK